ncbi:MAG TPA: branched-chain amino acid ABC transporter permease [Azospirillaceae bacterium]|nr:branched-chain amino acid ABC transporter permease [Azospirillaceae bacterium]
MTAETIAPPRPRRTSPRDWLDANAPYLIVPVLVLAALLAIGNPATWLTLTVAGLAMGMMIFVMASGLTLVFGLMDVLNFGHGAFITIGAYVGVSVLLALAGWTGAPSAWLNWAAMALAMSAAVVVASIAGWFFERVIVMPVYGAHLKQILITMGGLIVAEQIVHAVWGPLPLPLSMPSTFKGVIPLGDFAVERYRVYAAGIGLVIFAAMVLVLTRTRIGLLIRAGVENGEMVEALGYRIRLLFVAVFVAGSALAGFGGVMWAVYQEVITPHIGGGVMILVFIVVIIGGLGSIGGCFIGALLIGLMMNYTGYLAPRVALVSSILLMVAVLLWRPQGLFPVVKVK